MGKRLSIGEFTAMIALMFSLIAIGSDAMLPALGVICTDLDVINANDTQLIITVFFLGTGLGQLVAGPLSDAYGRKVVLGGGILIFILMGFICTFTTDFTWLIIARFVQGLGVSAPRAVGNALVRDLYKGRQMARVISLAMMLFVVVPAAAPFIGQAIMLSFGWRAIFGLLIVIGLLCFLWLMIRQEETHPHTARRPFRAKVIAQGFIETFTHKRVIISTLSVSLIYAILFTYIAMSHQIYVEWLDVGNKFPIYFAISSIIALFSNAVNARYVERYGMWLISMIATGVTIIVSLLLSLSIWLNIIPEPMLVSVFLIWSCILFFCNAMCFGNINALAMEPMGHIAGIASAMIGASSTTISIIIAVIIGKTFDGTGLPMITAITLLAIGAMVLNYFNPKDVRP